MKSGGKRAVAACLAGLLLAGAAPAGRATERFEDVPPGAWYAPAVDYVRAAGMFAGVGEGKFIPNAPMSRAMLVTVLSKRSGGAEDFQKYYNVTTPAYGDIPDGIWYENPVKWARYAQIISGKGESVFAPCDPVTRQEAAVILYQYARRTGHDVSPKDGEPDQFTDGESAAPWAKEALSWAIENQLLSGLPDGSLQPGKVLTRAEGAVVLQRLDAIAPNTKVIYPMTQAAGSLGITAENYPRVAGGIWSLQTELYRAMYGDVIPPESRLGPTAVMGAYQALSQNEVDLILVPEVPEDVEALAGNVELERVEIGRAALVFYTCRENTTQGFTLEQVKEIYRGRVASWQALGGPENPLMVLDSDRTQDDDRLQLERLILQGEPIRAAAKVVEAGRMLYFTAWGHTFEGSDQSAYYLGFDRFRSSLFFPDISAGELKPLEFEGIAPTQETVGDGSYPLSYSYYAVFRKDLPEDHPVRKLVSWLESVESEDALYIADIIK